MLSMDNLLVFEFHEDLNYNNIIFDIVRRIVASLGWKHTKKNGGYIK